jgi:PIN domain nuclease of toxin-antitoxin system
VLRLGIRELPLTGEVAIAATELGGLHPDPSDRILIATAQRHGALLLTADGPILDWRGDLPRRNAEL